MLKGITIDPEEVKEAAEIFEQIISKKEKKECWKHYKVQHTYYIPTTDMSVVGCMYYGTFVPCTAVVYLHYNHNSHRSHPGSNSDRYDAFSLC